MPCTEHLTAPLGLAFFPSPPPPSPEQKTLRPDEIAQVMKATHRPNYVLQVRGHRSALDICIGYVGEDREVQ